MIAEEEIEVKMCWKALAGQLEIIIALERFMEAQAWIGRGWRCDNWDVE